MTNPQEFCQKVLETFLLKAKVYLLERHPKLLEIIEFLERGEIAVALILVKVVRLSRSPASLSPSFGRVERLVYTLNCS